MSEEDEPAISDAARGVHDPNIRLLSPRATDADRAKALRDRMTNVLGEIIDILDDAHKDGIRIGFQLSTPNALGKHHVCMLEILKEL